MFQKTRFPFAVLLATAGMVALGAIHSQALEVKVFLLGGQSNMVGQAPPSGLPTSPVDLQQPQSDVLFYYGSSLTTLRPGSGGNPPGSGLFGPEITFGRAVADASPSVAYAIIKHGENGTALYNDWAPGTGSSYTRFRNVVADGLAAIQAAGHTTEVLGMLWHQGESDAIEGQQANYQSNLTAFIADVRSHYGADLPFLIGEIRNNGGAYSTVIAAQSAVAASDPNTSFVAASDLHFQDSLHLSASGQMALGERFASAYAALTGGGPVDTTPPTLDILTSVVPADGATDVSVSSALEGTFSEPVALTGVGSITLKNLSGGADIPVTLPGEASVSGAVLTINPASNLVGGQEYAVEISNGAIIDLAVPPNAYAGRLSTDSPNWSFTTGSATTVIIPTGATAGSTLPAGNRNIAYVIGGQGFDEGTQLHAAFAEGNSWTSNVIPAGRTLDIVFDLGDNYDLDAAYIWNWNHAGTVGASIGQLEILVASTVGGPAISLGDFALDPGTGSNNYAADSLAINPSNVREVTFRLDTSVASNQGFPYQGGYLLGLAEVRFGGSVVTDTTFASWIADFTGVGLETGIGHDPDGDGTANGVENYFGTNPGTFSVGLVAGTARGNTFTFTHPVNDTPATDLTASYTWSTDLETFHAGGATAGGVRVDFSPVTNAGIATVTATVTTGSANRLFVRVEVAQSP